MEKLLERQMPFGKSGKAKVVITVKYYNEVYNVDGHEFQSDKLRHSADIVLVDNNGKKIDSDYMVRLHDYNNRTKKAYEKLGADKSDKFSAIGGTWTQGEETYHSINETIDEMHDIICKELGILTADEEREQHRINWAKHIIRQAEIEGVDTLMTKAQIKKWQVNYNNVMNEGGEGYIPERISQEDYQKALEFMER